MAPLPAQRWAAASPDRYTHMAHCSFSFLIEPYSAYRAKSRRSAQEWCQVRHLLRGTEVARQTSLGALDVKTTPDQFILV